MMLFLLSASILFHGCSSVPFSAEGIQHMLDLHNEDRKAAASYIPNLEWDRDMAAFAEEVAEGLVDGGAGSNKNEKDYYCEGLEHSDKAERNSAAGCDGSCGENLGFTYSSGFNHPDDELDMITDVYFGWSDEQFMYNIQDNSCSCTNCGNNTACKDRCEKRGAVCGHYTQCVWDDSVKIGCGGALCDIASKGLSGATFYVACVYSPAGNMNSGRPYDRALYTTTLSASALDDLKTKCESQTNPDDGDKGDYVQETVYECGVSDNWCWKKVKKIYPSGAWSSSWSANSKCV